MAGALAGDLAGDLAREGDLAARFFGSAAGETTFSGEAAFGEAAFGEAALGEATSAGAAGGGASLNPNLETRYMARMAATAKQTGSAISVAIVSQSKSKLTLEPDISAAFGMISWCRQVEAL